MPARHLAAAILLSVAACASPPDAMPPVTALPPLPDSAFADDEAVLSPDELRADLDALYQGLREAHYDLFARRSEEAYDALHAELRASLDAPLRASEAALLFQRFAAFGNIAHARVENATGAYNRFRSVGGRAIAVFPRIRDGRIFVAESNVEGILPGDEILAIDGKPAPFWLERLGRNISADNDYLEGTLLELMFPSAFFAEVGAPASVTLSVRAADGEVQEITAPFKSRDELAAFDSAEGEGFTFNGYGRKAEMLPGGIAYLQPGPFYGIETPENPWNTDGFHAFIDESFEGFIAEEAEALLIDLRQNPGGDNSFSDRMIAWFANEPFRFSSEFLVRSSPQSEASNQARIDLNPESAKGVSGDLAAAYGVTPHGETFAFEIPFAYPVKGRRFDKPVFALIDRYSFSNAVNVAAILQDYGFAVVLGEETSDLATTYGAMETFSLPHSGLAVGYPKALIIRPSGDMADRGVVPDVAIEVPVFSTRDVALEKAIEVIRSRTEG